MSTSSPSSPTAIPDWSRFSHARSIQCGVITKDLHGASGSPIRPDCQEYLQDNDRGALLRAGTYRLPLDRHACGQALWRFFGDLGDVELEAGSTQTLLYHQMIGIEADHEKIFRMLEGVTKVLLGQPSMANSQTFGEVYCIHLYVQAKRQTLAFVRLLFGFYALLLKHHPGADNEEKFHYSVDPWDEELRLKQSAWFIHPVDHQHEDAQYILIEGDACFDEGDIPSGAWFYLRALLVICPWYPTEWYMTFEEIQSSPGCQLIWYCLNRLSYYAWTLATETGDVLAKVAARFVVLNPYVTNHVAVEAGRLLWRAGQDMDKMNVDRSRSWESIVGEDSLVLSSETIKHKEPMYSKVSFSAIDVVRWSWERYDKKKTSSIWNFESEGLEEIIKKAEERWRMKYGNDKLPFVWDGTEDEALREELGQPPSAEDVTFASLVPHFSR